MQNIIENRSDFPTTYLQELASFVLDQVGIKSTVKFVFKRHRTFSGSAFNNRVIIRMNRCWRQGQKWPHIHSDSRISFGHPIPLLSRTAAMVYLIGHELAHVRDRLSGKDGGFSAREYRANDVGESVSKKYQEHKVKLWKVISVRLRKERRAALNREQREVVKSSTIRSPEFKRDQVQKKLEQWQRRLKLAQFKVRKYKQKVLYYDKKVVTKQLTIQEVL